MRKKSKIIIIALLMLLGLTGCSSKKTLQGALDNEIITTTPVDQEKTMITVRVEFGVGQQDNFEKVLEEKFPDVDFVLRHDGSTSSVYTVKANLEAGVECDLILSRRLTTTDEIADQYLLDLSSEKFVDNYYMNVMDSCATSDGKIYYLPGPSDIYGIVYDKTMFEEYGWELPHSYSEFVALLDTIRQTETESGQEIVPLQVSMMYPDMFQILFNTYSYEDVYRGSSNYMWLTGYQQGTESMIGHMEKAAEDFKQLFEDGLMSVSDMQVTPLRRSEMLYVEHSAAMIIECQNAVNYARSMNEDEENMHEIAMMPFWVSDGEDSDYLYSIPSYYIAINKASAQESTKKKELLLEIFSYLSSEEGQEMLIGDDFQMSNITGVQINSNEFSEGIINTVERGHIINTFYFAAGETDKQVERQMLATAADMVLGDMSVEEWLLAADEVRDQFLSGAMGQEESYGQVKETLTRLETAYTMAQMYASVTDAQIGICHAGGWSKSTNGYLYAGDITDSSLTCITPEKEAKSDDGDPMENCIVTASLTGAQILDILNNTVEPSDTSGLNTYYVASGLDVVYNPWAGSGNCVISCKLLDGSEIGLDEVYEVAYFNGSLPDDSIEPDRALELSWKETFIQWLDENGGTIEKPEMTLELKYE